MPHFLCYLQFVLVKISQLFTTALLKTYIFKNIFFVFVESVLPPFKNGMYSSTVHVCLLSLQPPVRTVLCSVPLISIRTSSQAVFQGPNRLQIDGVRGHNCRLYAEKCQILYDGLRFAQNCVGRTLWWKSNISDIFIERQNWRRQEFGLRSVAPIGKNITGISPFLTGKIVAMVCPADGALLNSVFENVVWCHSYDCCFDSLSTWWKQILALRIVSAQKLLAVAFLSSLCGHVSISNSQRA
jgi:hypothetical protein